ncbi:hypothetical protein [Amycolatopsis sp. cmx-11-32]|uniref:hypothetical protein n=1 Tax=Amycolatopsis sp. cmx-11-32 TaxID=2785796 RepID=UPI0039E50076
MARRQVQRQFTFDDVDLAGPRNGQSPIDWMVAGGHDPVSTFLATYPELAM